VARGYLGNAALTAERYIPNPFSAAPGARLYRTGDLARFRPDDVIELIDRVDDQVKVRGFRIELAEIEAVLNEHPVVQSAVVLVREDKEGDKRLVAFLVGHAGQAGSAMELRQFLNKRLVDYMIPAAFVFLDKLPLAANGKIDRSALLAEQPPVVEPAVSSAPRLGVEQLVAHVWQDVLQIDNVGVHDNFFDLGGHSLLLVRVQSKLHESLRQDVPLLTMFQYPTIYSLAAHLSANQAAAPTPAPDETLQKLEAGKDRQAHQRELRRHAAAMT